MIVCICNAVNDRDIRAAVAAGHDSFDALAFELGVGLNCGKCVAMACDVLCEARGVNADAHVHVHATNGACPLVFTRRGLPAALPSTPHVALAA